MSLEFPVFEPENIDSEAFELQSVLAIWAVFYDCTVDELTALLQRVMTLPRVFSENPLANLDGYIALTMQLPQTPSQTAADRALLDDIEQTELTFVEFIEELLDIGVYQVEVERQQAEKARHRLEKLFDES